MHVGALQWVCWIVRRFFNLTVLQEPGYAGSLARLQYNLMRLIISSSLLWLESKANQRMVVRLVCKQAILVRQFLFLS